MHQQTVLCFQIQQTKSNISIQLVSWWPDAWKSNIHPAADSKHSL